MKEPSFAYHDQVDESVLPFIGEIPKRWGRMNPLSRLLIVEVGRLLIERDYIKSGDKCTDTGLCVGLIGGTARGCLQTDMDFIDSMQGELGLASPAIFGYTLPNTPLAEVAGQFGLTGPVYAVFEEANPLERAEDEAKQLLRYHPELSFMLTCQFDHMKMGDEDRLLVNLNIVEK